jgi:hypothetical protein
MGSPFKTLRAAMLAEREKRETLQLAAPEASHRSVEPTFKSEKKTPCPHAAENRNQSA